MQAVTDLEIVHSLHLYYTLKRQGLLMQWNPEYSSRNLETHADGWNLVSKFH